jgi:hypothetical protein
MHGNLICKESRQAVTDSRTIAAGDDARKIAGFC